MRVDGWDCGPVASVVRATTAERSAASTYDGRDISGQILAYFLKLS